MPAWLIPAIKAVLPHLGTIVSAAAPVFTRKNTVAGQAEPQQQIAELQAAATANDAHIKELAAQIKKTVEVLETAAAVAESRHQRLLAFCIGAILLSMVSLGIAMLVFFNR